MYNPTSLLALLLAVSATGVLATPFALDSANREILQIRANTNVNPDAVTGTTCTDTTDNIDTHDMNVATLAICGGIAGSIQKCGGNPATTTGASGTAKFELSATDAGSTINVSKGRWEGCIRAARATCPTGSFTSTCLGGATPSGDVDFSLTAQ